MNKADIQYIYSPDYRCNGYRPEMQSDIQYRFMEARGLFQVAYRNGTYMATHAGILGEWKSRYYDRLTYYSEKYSIDIKTNLDVLLNAINETHDRWILYTIPIERGGVPGSIGGPLWTDESEILQEPGCSYKYTHIVGHNKVKEITEHISKGGVKTIFTDCLSYKNEFLILKK